MQMTSGSMPWWSTANSSPGAAEAALHLVGDEQDAVRPAALDDAVQEGGRRRHVAALAEHRLEDHRRRLRRRRHRRQEAVEPAQRLGDRGVLVGGQRVGERGDEDPRRQRRVAGAVDRLRRRHRHRQVGAAVERAGEDDHVRSAGDLLGQLDRGLGDLGAGVGEEERVDGPGRDLGEARRQRLEEVVGEHVRLGVDERARPGWRSPRRRAGGCGRSS